MSNSTSQKDGENDLVSFRLDPEFRKLLQEAAAKNHQPKPNLFARTLVQRALSGSLEDELRGGLDDLREELHKMREDIATLAFVLLVKACKEDPNKAESWVRDHLAP